MEIENFLTENLQGAEYPGFFFLATNFKHQNRKYEPYREFHSISEESPTAFRKNMNTVFLPDIAGLTSLALGSLFKTRLLEAFFACHKAIVSYFECLAGSFTVLCSRNLKFKFEFNAKESRR